MDKKLVLENGITFYGKSFGSKNKKIAELVFNTSMVGYQEILSDPSYCGQMVCMTYPLIGNYGLTEEDYESKNIYISGFIVREYNDLPSNFRYTKKLGDAMEENDVAGISEIDTRYLTQIIRDNGSMLAMICDADYSDELTLKELKEYKVDKLVLKQVSTKKIWYSRTPNPKYNIVAVDCGMKMNIVRKLNQLKCNVTVVPYDTSFEKIMELNPDGLFISNGPGDPMDVVEVIELIKEAKGKIPILGICLGHQIIGLACGAKTYKMKFGHRGANHPVKNLETGKIEITSQNHSYAIDINSLKDTTLELTHINEIDHEPEGMMDKKNYIISVQYHPESAAGPEDSEYIFNKFIDLIDSFGGEHNA